VAPSDCQSCPVCHQKCQHYLASSYENNQDTANDYFSGPQYPQSAVDGYPAEVVGNGGNGAAHASYNPPEDDGATEA